MIWPFKKRKEEKRSVNPMIYKRSYVGAESGRLYNWQSSSDKSADGEINSALPILRRRSRELIQNEPLAKRYLSLLNTQVIGRQGIKLQMKARNDDSTLDLPAHNMVEGCGVSGHGNQIQCIQGVMSLGSLPSWTFSVRFWIQ